MNQFRVPNVNNAVSNIAENALMEKESISCDRDAILEEIKSCRDRAKSYVSLGFNNAANEMDIRGIVLEIELVDIDDKIERNKSLLDAILDKPE